MQSEAFASPTHTMLMIKLYECNRNNVLLICSLRFGFAAYLYRRCTELCYCCADEWATRDWRLTTVRCPVDGRGTRCGHRIRNQRLRRRPAVATDRRGRAVDRGGRRGHRAAGQSEGDRVRGHQAATTVRAGAGAGAVPQAAQPVPVVAAARAVHDNAVQGAQPQGVHKRGRRQARDTVAHAGTVAAHPVGPIAGLQHARGDRGAVRRLLADRQRVLLRPAPEVFQLGNYARATIMRCTTITS